MDFACSFEWLTIRTRTLALDNLNIYELIDLNRGSISS
jgi:hypothetical protein